MTTERISLSKTPENPHNLPIFEIDIKKADGYIITEQMIVERKLKNLRLYGRQFAYSAFPPGKT